MKKNMKKTMVLAMLHAFAVCAGAAELPRWKIVCGSMEGPEGRAVELLTSELGDTLLREPGIYATHVLPVWTAAEDPATNGNAIVIGTLADNAVLAKRLKPTDVPAGGYCVKAFSEDGRELVLIAGAGPKEALWGASDYLTDGIAAMLPDRGNGISFRRDVMKGRRLRDYEVHRAPKTAVRSVFTWAHPIADYREYIRNLARLRFNRVYLWNDYPPRNAAEIVAYAHSWGVEVFWGFAWGWLPDCSQVCAADDAAQVRTIMDAWRGTWRMVPGDGIYFQTFTEVFKREGEKESVAARAVRVVNAAAAKILAEDPKLRLVFGLHAHGVADDLDEIAKTDPRLEILWENTGSFPYWHRQCERGVTEAESAALTEKVISDEVHPVGIVWKCLLVQDWTCWTHQEGPYLLGVTSRRTRDADVAVHDEPWHLYTEHWLANWGRAVAAARLAQGQKHAVEMNAAAQLNGPIRLPVALLAELFWDASGDKDEILSRVLKRKW